MPSEIVTLLAEKSKASMASIISSGDALVTFINPYSYQYFRRRTHVLAEFDHLLVDGASLRYVLNLSGVSNCRRRSFDFSSIAGDVFTHAEAAGIGVSMVGSDGDDIEAAVTNIKRRYPALRIVHSRDGFFSDKKEISKSAEDIRRSGAGIVVVGMGSGRQEEFLVTLRASGWRGVGFTCGGFIHQTAKSLDYYPEFIRKTGLRWMYRLIHEPLKVGKRLLFAYLPFLFYFIEDWTKWAAGR